MIIASQIRRKTKPGVLQDVYVYIDDIKIKFGLSNGSPSEFCQLRLRVHSVTGGMEDDPTAPWATADIEKIFYANATQLNAVDARLRGSGNLMAGVRAFCKARIDEHNESVMPGGAAAVHTDVDDDNP